MKAPRWHRGQGRQLKADDLNQVAAMAEAAYNLTVGSGLAMDTSGGTRRLRLTNGATTFAATNKRVAVTAAPETVTGALTVRAIGYASVPPRPGVFRWDGVDFVAYPDVGLLADAFEDYVWSPVVDGAPTSETTILQAHYRDGYWLVTLPGGAGGGLVPVMLMSTSGGGGGVSGPPSYVYDVRDPETTQLLVREVSPGGLVAGTDNIRHISGRPNIGFMSPANFGLGYYLDGSRFRLIWCNEAMVNAPCET